jgi:hypothetical protein
MLIASGTDLRRIESRPAVASSEDGIIWSEPVDPFGQLGNAIGFANSGSTTIVLNDRGMVAHSTNLADWSTAIISAGNFSPRAIDSGVIGISDPIWMMAGQQKFPEDQGPYRALDEAAQIFRNTTGSADDWELIYSHAPDSLFHGSRFLTIDGTDTWMALGSDSTGPLVMRSIDSGITWQTVTLPQLGSSRVAYDAAVANGRLWITIDSAVLSVSEQQAFSADPDWDASPLLRPDFGRGDLVKIAANGIGQLVAAASAGLYITADLTSWRLFSVPGYRFRSCCWDPINQLWLASAEGQLLRSTLWTSRDTLTWTESNNLVQAYDLRSI